ncbi:hypothetical protein GCM10025868_17180 [Angustibacter aerolatus]|uniref:Uncharacterized protein n=1 Tax=Angustibacter aerolatus TaxID=1162965 RepID=A0ABQ6JE54_9ACTN|nr:hypothetical protein GCM10025868_17180 [Angustibacter aerolatus]
MTQTGDHEDQYVDGNLSVRGDVVAGERQADREGITTVPETDSLDDEPRHHPAQRRPGRRPGPGPVAPGGGTRLGRVTSTGRRWASGWCWCRPGAGSTTSCSPS